MSGANKALTWKQEREQMLGKPLTDTEKEVLKLVCWGYTIEDIADELGITDRLAKYRCDCIRYKTGVRRKPDLILYTRRELPKLWQARPQ